MLLATDSVTGLNAMRDYGTSPEHCNGSLAVYYITDVVMQTGPRIVALLRRPNAVPITLRMVLPYNLRCTDIDYSGPEIVFQAAAFLSLEDPFSPGPGYSTDLPTPSSIEGLGFEGNSCAPFRYDAIYGSFLTGNVDTLGEAFPGNQTFISQLVPYNKAEVCVSAISNNADNSRDSYEDACAQLYFGDAGQQREEFVTFFDLNTTAEPDTRLSDRFESYCGDLYRVSIENILPQVSDV
jgi:hypothetical protein